MKEQTKCDTSSYGLWKGDLMEYWQDLELIKDSDVLIEGMIYLCFRPDVIFDDHTDAPIKALRWNGDKFEGGCHSVKSVLLINELPSGYNEIHKARSDNKIGRIDRPYFK